MLIPLSTTNVLFSFLHVTCKKANWKKTWSFYICLVLCALRPSAPQGLRCGCSPLSLFVNHMYHWHWKSMCPLRGTHVYTQAKMYLSLFSPLPLEQLSQNSTTKKMENNIKKWEMITILFFFHTFVLNKLMANITCDSLNSFQP